jgi:uncharacterized protein (DUF1499 family)
MTRATEIGIGTESSQRRRSARRVEYSNGRPTRPSQFGRGAAPHGGGMVVVKWVLSLALAIALAALAVGQAGLLRGRAPTDLGVRDGRLRPPSPTPNSVSSQTALYPGHAQRDYAHIAALPLRGSGPATIAKNKTIVESADRTEVIRAEPDYLYVQFTSRLMGYVDDAEFWFDPTAQAIQVRSASRLGSKDFGANRAHIESVRQRLAAS